MFQPCDQCVQLKGDGAGQEETGYKRTGQDQDLISKETFLWCLHKTFPFLVLQKP